MRIFSTGVFINDSLLGFVTRMSKNVFCPFLQKWNGGHNFLHSKLRDTIINREVPLEAILEGNKLLIELEEVNVRMTLLENHLTNSGENEENESSKNDGEDIVID